ncbi:hypothetical protein C8J57DRAFT_1229103 [Mycena rebaudengoi]|nr:hypothetical protein C8J57DRAFT_1229103 [Mycena rebaudengoi]
MYMYSSNSPELTQIYQTPEEIRCYGRIIREAPSHPQVEEKAGKRFPQQRVNDASPQTTFTLFFSLWPNMKTPHPMNAFNMENNSPAYSQIVFSHLPLSQTKTNAVSMPKIPNYPQSQSAVMEDQVDNRTVFILNTCPNTSAYHIQLSFHSTGQLRDFGVEMVDLAQARDMISPDQMLDEWPGYGNTPRGARLSFQDSEHIPLTRAAIGKQLAPTFKGFITRYSDQLILDGKTDPFWASRDDDVQWNWLRIMRIYSTDGIHFHLGVALVMPGT